MTNSYALTHLLSAALHARNSGAIEDSFASEPELGLRFHSDNEAFVISAVFHSVAFLEATINEFFVHLAEDSYEDFRKIYDKEICDQIKHMWKMKIPQTAAYPTLQKYDIALVLCRKAPSEKGVEPYQSAELLVKLRNYLIHAEPEIHTLFTIGNIEGTKNSRPGLVEGLKNKFPENKLMAGFGNAFFPYKCLGHGCAAWAVESSIAFTDKFFSELGLTPFYDGLGDKLATKWKDDSDAKQPPL